jgi:hypothetical protein
MAAVAVAGCGGGTPQDENEPDGNFEVEVPKATFPKKQTLAKSSDLAITVRNTGSDTVPNLAVTVNGFGMRSTQPDVGDPSRPRFAVNGVPVNIGGLPEARDSTPHGCGTVYVNTWACGPLKAGDERTLRWTVTPVVTGPYEIKYRVAAGLNGNAKAVLAGGEGAPEGSFSGVVSDKPGHSQIAADGHTVVNEPR